MDNRIRCHTPLKMENGKEWRDFFTLILYLEGKKKSCKECVFCNLGSKSHIFEH